jgi:hypothetical protein
MQIKDMTVMDTIKRGMKKIVIEAASVKFWGAVFLGYLNAHIVLADHKFDVFGMTAFLVLLGIREAADLLQQKNKQGGGDPK